MDGRARAVCVHIKVCPVRLSEFRLRRSHQGAALRRVPADRDARLAHHRFRDAKEIFPEVRHRVEERRQDVAVHRDEFAPELQTVDNSAARPDAVLRQTEALPDEMDNAVLLEVHLRDVRRPLPQEQGARVEMQDCLECVAAVQQVRRAAAQLVRHQVSLKLPLRQPREQYLASRQQVRAPEDVLQDEWENGLERVQRSHSEQPMTQALLLDAPPELPELLVSLQSQELKEQPSQVPQQQVSQSPLAQALQPRDVRRVSSPPWPSLACPLPRQLPSRRDR